MKHRILAGAILAGALMLTGCSKGGVNSNDPGAVFSSEMTRVADALESVKDEASARKAAAEISQAAEQLEKVREKFNDGNLGGIQAMRTLQKHGKELMTTQARIMSATLKLQEQHPELMEILSTELDKIESP